MLSTARGALAALALLSVGLAPTGASACDVADGQFIEVSGELYVDDGGGRYWILHPGYAFCGNQDSAGIEIRVWGFEEAAYDCRWRQTTVSGVYSTARSNALGEHIVLDSLHCW